MNDENGGYTKALDQQLQTIGVQLWRIVGEGFTKTKNTGCGHQDNRQTKAIKPDQFRIFQPVFHHFLTNDKIFLIEKPTNMAIPKPMLGRVEVFGGICVTMMIAVMRSPPKRPTLCAHRASAKIKIEQDEKFEKFYVINSDEKNL